MSGSPPRDTHIAALFGYALANLRQDTDALGAEFPGLRSVHFRLLSLIPEGGGRMTELAPHAAMSKQAFGQFTRYLEGLGYVSITVDPADRRARVVARTAAGQRAEQAGRTAIARVERRWREQLGERRYEALRAALTELAEVDGRPVNAA